MQLTSPVIKQGGEIPSRYTSDGENISPELSWQNAPAETKSFALVVHDPDAPMPGGFTHWLVYNIPSEATQLAENVPNKEQLEGVGLQGKNDGKKIGYIGPAPPSGTHRYFFRLFALDKLLDIPPGVDHKQLNAAIAGHILAQYELMGTYEKKSERAA